MPDGWDKSQKGPLSIEGRLFCYKREWLDDLDGMIGDDNSLTGAARKERRAGKVGFLAFGIVVVVAGLSGGGSDLQFLLTASVVRAARCTRQEEDV